MDPLRRKILETGAAAAAMATASRVLAQTGSAEGATTFYERGPVRIHYEEAGSGFPLMLIAGGGLNSTISGLKNGSPFNPIDEFKNEYRCIAADLRNANGGQSSGPLEIDRRGMRTPTITSGSWITSASTSSWCWGSASVGPLSGT
jgi:hypothetical protein